jgi:hypothetical protein
MIHTGVVSGHDVGDRTRSQPLNLQQGNNLDICAQFRLKYFEIIDGTTGREMKRHSTESDVVLNALCSFSPHSHSLFSGQTIQQCSELDVIKCPSLNPSKTEFLITGLPKQLSIN